MRITKVYLILLLCTFNLSVSAQSYPENQSVELNTKALRKANDKLQKSLSRLEKELQKSRADGAASNNDSLSTDGLQGNQRLLEKEANDSLNHYLERLKTKLKNDLNQTPDKLPVSEEVRESIRQLQSLQSEIKNPASLEAMGEKELQALVENASNLKNALSQYKNEFADWDQKLLDQVTSLPEARLLKEKLDRAKSFKLLPENLTNKAEQFQSNDFVKEQLSARAEELKKLGAETLQQKFDAGLSRMEKLKQRFPNIRSLQDSLSGGKPNAGTSFLKRFNLGGNLQLNQQQPRFVNLSLSLTYRVSKKVGLGASGATRIYLEKTDPSLLTEEQSGIRSFLRFNLWQNFYGQANYELTRIVRKNPELPSAAIWAQNTLVGLGKSTRVSKGIRLNITAFYDFFYNRQTSPNPQAWVVRLGFDFAKN